MLVIYHNPRCSKSRGALEILEAYAASNQRPLKAVEYLKTPLSIIELKDLQRVLAVPAIDMVRTNEEPFEALKLANASDAALLEAIASHPQLLQRPIIVDGDRAIIARPPKLLDNFLSN